MQAFGQTTAANPAAQASAKDDYPPLKLGEHIIPRKLETRHILMVGTTGSGKSQAILQNLEAIRVRREPAIILDNSCEFLTIFHRPGRDLILNAFDARSLGWSPFNELFTISDFARVSKLVVPDLAAGANNQDWQRKAQRLCADILRALFDAGRRAGFARERWGEFRTNEVFLHYIRRAHIFSTSEEDVDSLQYLLQGSGSERLFMDKESKSLGICLDILADYTDALGYMPEGDFSVTKFVQGFVNPDEDRFLFVSYNDMNFDALAPVMAMVLSCASSAIMSLPKKATRQHYLVTDEMDSLPKLSALRHVLTKGRKRGAVVIGGIQTTAQPEETYGEKGAQTMLANFGSQLYLRVSDEQTAEKYSKLLGEVEVLEKSESENVSSGVSGGHSIGAHGSANSGWSENTSTNTSKQKKVKRLVLPAEFMELPDLTGYARIAGAKLQSTSYNARRAELLTKIPICKLTPSQEAEVPRSSMQLEI